MITITIRKERDFSVGYSQEERERLVRSTSILETFKIHPKCVTRSQEGEKIIVGAYNGYKTEEVKIDGIEIPYGERVESVKAVREAYKTQDIAAIARAVHTLTASSSRNSK